MIKTFFDDAYNWLFAYTLWPLYRLLGILTIVLPVYAVVSVIYSGYQLIITGTSFGSLPISILFPLVWTLPLTALCIVGSMFIHNLIRWSDVMRSGLRRQADAIAGRTL